MRENYFRISLIVVSRCDSFIDISAKENVEDYHIRLIVLAEHTSFFFFEQIEHNQGDLIFCTKKKKTKKKTSL